jgi:hypothetical protein
MNDARDFRFVEEDFIMYTNLTNTQTHPFTWTSLPAHIYTHFFQRVLHLIIPVSSLTQFQYTPHANSRSSLISPPFFVEVMPPCACILRITSSLYCPMRLVSSYASIFDEPSVPLSLTTASQMALSVVKQTLPSYLMA